MQQEAEGAQGESDLRVVKRIVIRNPWTILASACWTVFSAGSLMLEGDAPALINVVVSCAFLIGSICGSRFSFLPDVMRVRIWGIAFCDFHYGMELHLDGASLMIATTRLKWFLATPQMEETLMLIKQTYEAREASERKSLVPSRRFFWLFG